jgi:primosomal protein N' (replication factor Y) (superfamily II helicase)
MKAEAQRFACVVIPSPLRHALTYSVPLSFREQISLGTRVLVPVGKRKLTGVVFELLSKTARTETKEIIALCDDRPVLDLALLRLCQWIARYYLATAGEVLATLLPPNLRTESQRIIIAKSESSYRGDGLEYEILELLRQNSGKVTVKTMTRKLSGGSNVYHALAKLEAIGAVEICEQSSGQRHRKKILLDDQTGSSPNHPRFQLSVEQRHAWAAIDDRLTKGGFETFLLHGVTGSGKTEIYLRAMERVRETGRQSLILIPEISLTPQLIDRLNARFPGRVGILHSALTAAERWAYWWHIVRGHVDVVVGARSAVFAPLPNLGLIVVDEEHDSSYKQEEGLRYNGRDVAVVRGKFSSCAVVLGSATPALESYENSLRGRYTLLEMKTRIQQRPLPQIEIIDLRSKGFGQPASSDDNKRYKKKVTEESQNFESTLISNRLAQLLKDNFHKSRQSLIFLNRRGFSPYLQCRLCGYVLRCSHCSVTLTLHLKEKSLCCHHCSFSQVASELCPGCGNLSLAGVGAGTEQIQRVLNQLLPEARVARMDRDTTSKRGSHDTLIRSWEKGDIDILVGTQMITKGHDVSGVTLVGALLADLSLNVPDFRAAERTFQLLSQVAGRSGRGNDPGLVIVQTYAPDHYTIQHLINHDYKGFFAAEAEFRRALSYPPFSRLVHLRLEGPEANEIEAQAKRLGMALRDNLNKDPRLREQIDVLGPAPAPIHKLRNRYRWQLLLKGKHASALREFADAARVLLPSSRRVRLHIDVDPYSML